MKVLGLHILTIILTFNFCFSSDIRIHSLGGSSIYWQDDDEILNLFPNRLPKFTLFQISNIDDTHSENFKYVWGKENKFGLFATKGKGISLLYAKNNFGVKADIDFSLTSLDSTFTEMIEITIYDTTLSEDLEVITESVIAVPQDTNIKSNLNELILSMNFNINDMSVQIMTGSNDLFNIRFNILKEINSFGFEDFYGSLYYSTDSLDYKMASSSISIFRHFKNIPKLDILFSVSSNFIYKHNKNINSIDSTETIFELNLPKFTLALESEIRDWLVFRMGINKSLNYTSFNTEYDQNKINYDVTYVKWIEKDIIVNFGLGFQFKGFLVDVGIDGEVFRNPIQKVVGFDALGANTTATITYSW
jgi:hypothetical protein